MNAYLKISETILEQLLSEKSEKIKKKKKIQTLAFVVRSL